MRKVLLFIFLVQVGVIGSQRAPSKENPLREKIEWTDIWVVDANQDDLPRVLLVGDSITKGYFDAVSEALAGKAHCARFASSLFMGNPDYLDELKVILRSYRFSVIHINNGLHGWDYTEEQYRQSLPKLMETLKKYGKGAVVVWATTTPRRSHENPALLASDTDRVKERNRIAVEYMTQHGIAVDDLYSLVAEHPEYYRDDHTHFNDQGQAVEGKQVSEIIMRGLTSRPAADKGQ
jgi:lysophospholipase L1-like esterase